jgi:hypothetical protein
MFGSLEFESFGMYFPEIKMFSCTFDVMQIVDNIGRIASKLENSLWSEN